MTKKKEYLEVWDKQVGETTKSYAAFSIYRNMGISRSFKKAAIKYLENNDGKLLAKVRQFEKWSIKYNWVSRVESWDIEQEQEERIENAKAVKDMAKRHANESMLLQQKAIDRIKFIINGNDENGNDIPSELSPNEALKFLSEAIKIERLSRGTPDQIIEHGGKIETIDRSLERIIPQDPETREMIDELLTRLATEQSSRVRISGERREMDTSKTP